MNGWAISLGEGKEKKTKMSILESLSKGVRKLANLATIHSYIDLSNS